MDSKETEEVSLAILLWKNIGNINQFIFYTNNHLPNLLALLTSNSRIKYGKSNCLQLIIINKKGPNKGAFNI